MARRRVARSAAILLGALVSILALAGSAGGFLPEPPNIFHGAVTRNGLPLSRGLVTIVVAGQPEPAAACAIGSLPWLPNGYALKVVVDAQDPRAPGSARPGDAAEILVDGQSAAQVVIGGRGSIIPLDLGITVPHALVFDVQPAGLPNPVASQGQVSLSCAASDTLGHAVSYTWSSICPGLAGGVFADAHARSTTWTAPDNILGQRRDCMISVTASDGALSLDASFVEVVEPSPASSPVAVARAVPNPAACGQAVAFDASGSHHSRPDRHIVLYEWDFDYDGATFAPDAQGVSVTHAYGTVGTHTAALRVTDDGSPPSSAIGTVAVTVAIDNRPPSADPGGPYALRAGQSLLLDASGSADPDAGCGDGVVSWEWDTNGDGLFGDVSGRTASLTWTDVKARICAGKCVEGRSYSIAVRVADTFGATAAAGTTFSMTYLLFSDTFTHRTPPTADPDWRVVTGKWRLSGATNKVYLATRTLTNLARLAVAPGGGPASASVEAKIKLSSSFLLTSNAALVFGSPASTRYRYVSFVGAPAKKIVFGQVGLYAGEKTGVKATKTLRTLPLNTWLRVRVDLYPNGTAKVYWNGKLQLSYRYKKVSTGNFGVLADRCASSVDDFRVWQGEVLPWP